MALGNKISVSLPETAGKLTLSSNTKVPIVRLEVTHGSNVLVESAPTEVSTVPIVVHVEAVLPEFKCSDV